MKKILSFAFIGVAFIMFAACSDDTETKVLPVPTVTLSTSSVTLSAEAVDSYIVNYTVTDPADGAAVSASANVSWISGVDATVSGQIRFSVAANTSGNLRLGNLTLTYSYDDGFVTAKAAVVQYGAGDPVLNVDPNAVVASASGGSYSFSYSVENPINGESIACSSAVSWITGFDYSEGGKVSFTVAAYTGEELRTGTITVSYADLSKQVTVVQDHPGSDSDSDSGSGGGGGGATGELVGTYTAHGTAYGNGITEETEMDWVVKIYPYEGSLATDSSYDYWYDGVIPWGAGAYDQYGDHRASAGVYVASNGTLHLPSQIANATLQSTSGDSYYLGYTPCVGKSENGGYQYSSNYPDLVFTYNSSTGVWTSDYGVFMAGCKSPSISTFTSYFQVVIPVITLTKTSDTTSLSVDDNRAAASFENIVPCFDFMVR